jgi:xylulokinase
VSAPERAGRSKPWPARYLGLDLGTSSLKAVALDNHGYLVASIPSAYPISRQHLYWAEQSPADWWVALASTIRDLTARGVRLDSLAAVGLTGQMHGLVLLNAHGDPLGPCQTWADARCVRDARLVERRIGRERLLSITGSRAYTSATAAKLLWVRRHDPDSWRAARHALLPKDYLRFRLTGELATDVSDASGMQLCAIAARDWSPDLLDALDIPRMLLPPIVESTAITGWVSAEAARATGLPVGVPVVAGGGDAECAAIGLGLLGEPGDRRLALATLGTAGQFFAVPPGPAIDPTGQLQTLCHAVPGRWHVMRAILAGGSALDWLASVLMPDTDRSAAVATLLDEAAAIPPGAHGLLFLPHLDGTRTPNMNPFPCGAFIGLRPDCTRACLTRAAVEGIALALREGLDAARSIGVPIERIRLAGGAFRHPLLARIHTDVFGLPVELGAPEDASALGAALLAAAGIGAFPSLAAASRLISPFWTTLDPDPAAAERYADLARVHRRLTPRLRSTCAELARAE